MLHHGLSNAPRSHVAQRHTLATGPSAVGQVEPRVMDPATLQQQILDDEELARQIQEELERDFNSLLLKQREERARKYRVFLKPYTMVVADADFSRENDGHGRNAQFQSVSFEFGSAKEEKIVRACASNTNEKNCISRTPVYDINWNKCFQTNTYEY